ncbi:MAG: FAD-binding oxidoreductase [Ignavibacteriae bacterium]|nr:FAD-binding oxidoreductase [Ignavibacteriota bacterium]MCB9244491.1 FAD-binding oxidoreductase [Ignavibacteriales bacterium]
MLSFWEKNSFLNWDYIIVGSGLVGLSVACSIREKNPKAEVLILEKGIFPTGASTKNAGFACFGSLSEILSDIEANGESRTVEIIEKRWRGIDELRKRLGDENIGYENYGGSELVFDRNINIVDQIDYVNELLKGVFKGEVFTRRDELIDQYGFNKGYVKGLVYSQLESQLDTGKMMRSYIKYAGTLGIQIINGCEVKHFEQTTDGADVTTYHSILNEDVVFKAKNMVICANAFTRYIVPSAPFRPGRGQILVTDPIPGLKFKGVFHFDEGFYYFRNYGERVIFGGARNTALEEEATDRFEHNHEILMHLKWILDTIILPGQDYGISDAWTGIMAFSENKLPVVEKHDGVMMVMSCNGMGVALSSLTGQEVAEMI